MDSLCIICLVSLPSAEAAIADATLPNRQMDDTLLDHLDSTPPPKADVAHLQNCRHTFHDHCLTVWVEVITSKLDDRLTQRSQILVLRVAQISIKSISQIQLKVFSPLLSVL
jgi:hypothetical protein